MSAGGQLPIFAIQDSDELFRRIVKNHLYPDGTVNSNAFKNSGKPSSQTPVNLKQSVDLARLTTIQASAARKPGCGVGQLVAGVPRAHGLQVNHDPEPANPSHSVIAGGFTKAMCRALATATSVVLQPQS